MKTNNSPRRVVLVGGGISGLAAAHRLHELDPSLDITLLEASSRPGGMVQTNHRDGFLVETGADGFITNVPWGTDLCRRLGMSDELIQTNSVDRRTFVVSRGKLEPMPDGFVMMAPTQFWPMLTTSTLSWRGKLRLACEPFIRRRVPRADGHDDESMAAFVRRRIGHEAYARLVQPLLGSIHTGDPERLSMSAILPRFVSLEREYGSLVRGMLRQAKQAQKASGAKSKGPSDSGARFSLFVAPRRGMTSLIDTLATKLPTGAVHLNARVARLAHRDGRWKLTLDDNRELDADGVVLATPVRGTATLLDDVDPALGELLNSIPHSQSAIVSLGYRREQIGHRLDGFGFVVPAIEGRNLLSCSFSSIKYAGRAPDGSVLLRAFVGGTGRAELLDRSDDQLRQTVTDELKQLLGVTGEPQLSCVSRAPPMPQYYLGHGELVGKIRRRSSDLPCFELVGNAYDGVGVPLCIRGAELAAQRLIHRMNQSTANRGDPVASTIPRSR